MYWKKDGLDSKLDFEELGSNLKLCGYNVNLGKQGLFSNREALFEPITRKTRDTSRNLLDGSGSTTNANDKVKKIVHISVTNESFRLKF